MDTFKADCFHELTRAQKRIPCKWLYAERGSALFKQSAAKTCFSEAVRQSGLPRRHGWSTPHLAIVPVMFHVSVMQMMFGFGAGEDVTWVRDRLRSCFGNAVFLSARTPIGQLVKSSISGRTRDAVSLAAYRRLVETYPDWAEIAALSAADIEAVIGDVTFADVKAQHLRAALRIIAAYRPDFDLTFLAGLGVARALSWLEELPGVGRKVSASTLNFSTLHMPAFVVDTHILRILRRFGFVRGTADTLSAYRTMMAILHDWSAADLAELHGVMKCLGQNICRADRACCGNCPISGRCRASAPRSEIP